MYIPCEASSWTLLHQNLILTNFFAEPTVLLVPITSRAHDIFLFRNFFQILDCHGITLYYPGNNPGIIFFSNSQLSWYKPLLPHINMGAYTYRNFKFDLYIIIGFCYVGSSGILSSMTKHMPKEYLI